MNVLKISILRLLSTHQVPSPGVRARDLALSFFFVNFFAFYTLHITGDDDVVWVSYMGQFSRNGEFNICIYIYG